MKAPGKKRTPAGPPDPRPMAVRSGGHHGIKYYLDANACVKEQSCYHVKVEGRDVTARLEKLAARGRA